MTITLGYNKYNSHTLFSTEDKASVDVWEVETDKWMDGDEDSYIDP